MKQLTPQVSGKGLGNDKLQLMKVKTDDQELQVTMYFIGVRKGDTELLAKINTSLAKLKANGTVEKILDKWGLKAQGT